MTSEWYCYILKSTTCNHTYNGKTNDLTRRLRQHNGEICGGAKATKNNRPWKYVCAITGFVNEKDALRAEWRIKHPMGHPKKRAKKFCGPTGRIKGLRYILQNCTQWTKQCDTCNAQKYTPNKLTIKVLKEYYPHLMVESLPQWVQVIGVDDIFL